MDASAALERLREISSQVREAVILERGGKVLATTLADDERGARVAEEARELLAAAESRRGSTGGDGELAQLEVALRGGSVFVVRHDDRLIVATTTPEPTVGLVFYDLKTCLRDLDTSDSPPKAPRKKAATRKATRPRKDAQS
jgi:predicted regulator of Ras-like GTPase activity (Roadblock/LC7/MglB family)